MSFAEYIFLLLLSYRSFTLIIPFSIHVFRLIPGFRSMLMHLLYQMTWSSTSPGLPTSFLSISCHAMTVSFQKTFLTCFCICFTSALHWKILTPSPIVNTGLMSFFQFDLFSVSKYRFTHPIFKLFATLSTSGTFRPPFLNSPFMTSFLTLALFLFQMNLKIMTFV